MFWVWELSADALLKDTKLRFAYLRCLMKIREKGLCDLELKEEEIKEKNSSQHTD